MKFKQMAMAAAIAAGFAVSGQAATDGTIGATSNGDFQIFLSKGDNAQIWGFQDLYFTADTTSADVPLCAHSTTGNIRFSVDSGTNDFSLTDGNAGTTNDPTYTVTINEKDSSDTASWGGSALADGVYANVDFSADTATPAANPVCTANSTEHKADLNVTVSGFAGAAAGTYQDTVTVTIFPI